MLGNSKHNIFFQIVVIQNVWRCWDAWKDVEMDIKKDVEDSRICEGISSIISAR